MTKKTRRILGDPAYSEEVHVIMDSNDAVLIESDMAVVEMKIFSGGDSLSADLTYENTERLITALQNALAAFKQ